MQAALSASVLYAVSDEWCSGNLLLRGAPIFRRKDGGVAEMTDMDDEYWWRKWHSDSHVKSGVP